MAVGAILDPVDTFEPESGDVSVIPLGRRNELPGLGCMTVPAVQAELEPITIVLAPLPVAGLAGLGCALKDPLEVALDAGNGPVFTDQGKIRFVVGFDRPLGNVLRGGGARQPDQEAEAQEEKPGREKTSKNSSADGVHPTISSISV